MDTLATSKWPSILILSGNPSCRRGSEPFPRRSRCSCQWECRHRPPPSADHRSAPVAADRAGALQSIPGVRLCRRGIEIAESESIAASCSSAPPGRLMRRSMPMRGLRNQRDRSLRGCERSQRCPPASTTLPGSRRTLAEARRLGAPRAARSRVGDDATPEAISELAGSLMLDAEVERGLEWCDAALAAAEREDSIPVFADTLITKGVGLGLRYRTREALILLNAGLDLSREHHLTASKRRVLQNLEYVTASDSPEKNEYPLEKLEDARRIGETRMLTEVSLSTRGCRSGNTGGTRSTKSSHRSTPMSSSGGSAGILGHRDDTPSMDGRPDSRDRQTTGATRRVAEQRRQSDECGGTARHRPGRCSLGAFRRGL